MSYIVTSGGLPVHSGTFKTLAEAKGFQHSYERPQPRKRDQFGNLLRQTRSERGVGAGRTSIRKVDNPRHKNPTKAQKKEKSRKASAQRKVATALAGFLKRMNPAAKITGASVVKLKGGVLKITPIKANPGARGRGARRSWAVYGGPTGAKLLGRVTAVSESDAALVASGKYGGRVRVLPISPTRSRR